MKRITKNVIVATLVAMVSAAFFAGCAKDVELSFENGAEIASTRSVPAQYTLYSDLNPGYGKAVYFTGTFYQGRNWTLAIRGTYNDGKWILPVGSYSGKFEYKALVGDWDLGLSVEAEMPELDGLVKVGEATQLRGYQGGASGYFVYSGEDINYGDAVYFYIEGAQYPYASRGTYYDEWTVGYCPWVYNSWIMEENVPYYAYDPTVTVYVAPYEWGERISTVFNGLTWEEGENHKVGY